MSGASILDLAPTLLYLLGLPIPRDMDGRVLETMLQPGQLAAHPIAFASAPDGGAGSEHDATAAAPDGEQRGKYSEEEEEAVRRRLQGLGYLE